MSYQLLIIFFALFINVFAQENVSEINQEVKDDIKRTIIKGLTKLNEIDYEAVCECDEFPTSINPDKAQCNPNKLKLKQDKKGQGLDMEQVRQLIGDLQLLEYTDPRKTSFSCMDGRIQKEGLSTPGGDAGEFILALHVYEGLLTRKLEQEQVDHFFSSFLKFMSQEQFYMCTDDDALSHLEKETSISLNIQTLINPKDSDQQQILNSLMKPQNHGSKHIKSMLQHPQDYSIRVELVHMFIKSFFKILWNKNNNLREKLVLDSLIGQADEKAFLEVRSNEVCQEVYLSPLIAPTRKVENQIYQAFVNHIDAASQKRLYIAKFFADNINHGMENVDAETMHHRMNKHGLGFLEATGSRVAKNLPFYALDLV